MADLQCSLLVVEGMGHRVDGSVIEISDDTILISRVKQSWVKKHKQKCESQWNQSLYCTFPPGPNGTKTTFDVPLLSVQYVCLFYSLCACVRVRVRTCVCGRACVRVRPSLSLSLMRTPTHSLVKSLGKTFGNQLLLSNADSNSDS